MNEFTCPRHGPYDRIKLEFAPERVLTTMCPSCRREWDAERESARRDFDQRVKDWRRWRASEVPQRYVTCTVDSWAPQPGQETAARMVHAWVDDVHARWDAGEGLLLMGAPGVGKTHLLAGLVAACIAAGYTARYASWPDVWDRCRPPFDGPSPESLLRELASVQFLALDEIGTRTGTEKEQARLFELIDSRYREELPTLIATNTTQATLPMIGERTADRLLEACIPVVIPGDSNRTRALARSQQPAIVEPAPVRFSRAVSIDGTDKEQSDEFNWRNFA